MRPNHALKLTVARVVWYSPLAIDDCIAAVRSALAKDDSGISGEVDGTSMRLRKRIEYNNGFRTVLRGEMSREAEGTRIDGLLGIDPRVIWAFVFIVAFIACAGARPVVEALRFGSPAQEWRTLVGLLILLVGLLPSRSLAAASPRMTRRR